MSKLTKAQRERAVAAIPPASLKRLQDICWSVWQYIGSDMLSSCDDGGESIDNYSAVESCFDADRPLLSNSSATPEADQEFCKRMYATHRFDVVTEAVSRTCTLV